MFLTTNTELKNGEYRILDCLGQGGFGITYLAHQVRLNRKVVIKEFYIKEYCDRDRDTLRVTLGTSGSGEMVARFLDKFLKEALNIAALKHSNIISIHDVFEENNTAYYVMEYHGAGSLGSLVHSRGALGKEDALCYVRQVASALGYIHSRRMMHLDVKPDNILIDDEGNAVLIDFGLAKVYQEGAGDNGNRPRTSSIATYSPGYAPLEQYNPSGVSSFSPATDIYSLGATLFTLLTGECPPMAMELLDNSVLIAKLERCGVERRLTGAIAKSMSPMKEARPQSVDEFLALLDAQPSNSNSAPLSSSTLNSGTVSRSVDEKEGNNGASRLVAPMNNDSVEVSRSAARTVNSGTVSRSVEEKGDGTSRQTAPMDNNSAEVSRSAARTVNSGTVSRSVEEKGGISRQTAPVDNDSAEVSRSAARTVNSGTVSRSVEEKGSGTSRQTAPMDNEPKKPFNWKIPVGIVAAILCVVFAGVGINNCNEERAEQERLAIIEKARRDSIATARKAAEDKRISDSVAAAQQRLLAENAALKQAAEQRRRDSIANLPGKLYVTTTPAGATVTVDGQRIGTTPINAYELKKGSYNVKIAKDGYKEYTERITITAEPANINTVLAANPVQQQQKSTASVVDGKKHTFTVNGVSFTMVAVAGGTFNMGSNDSEAYDNEKPVHSVTLGDYYIGETEVTQALWKAVMGSNPSDFKGSSNPVEQVSYDDCIDFVNELNTLLAGQLPAGRKFRLPTEAEWEFAARGGNKGKNNNYTYSGSNSIDAVAWYDRNSGDRTHPVKGKQPNELGLYDMSGNVSEWCYDWYGSYSSSPETNPQGPSSGFWRVLRGGDWFYDAQWCRVANRSGSRPGSRYYRYGLRLAF